MLKKEEVLRMIDAIHRDRGVEREILFVALEEALTMATRKRMDVEDGFTVHINRKSGQISLDAPGGEVELPSAEELGRIAAQTTKQVFMQKIREAERDRREEIDQEMSEEMDLDLEKLVQIQILIGN